MRRSRGEEMLRSPLFSGLHDVRPRSLCNFGAPDQSDLMEVL